MLGQPGAMAQTCGAHIGGGHFSGEKSSELWKDSHSDFYPSLSQRDGKKNQSGYILFDNVKIEVKEETLMMKTLWNLSFSSIKLANGHMWTIYLSRKQAVHYSLLVGRGYWLYYLPRTKQMFYSYNKKQLHLDNFQQHTHYCSVFVSQGFYMYPPYFHLHSGKLDSPASRRPTNCLVPVFITFYYIV